jgi:hypothetical protein
LQLENQATGRDCPATRFIHSIGNQVPMLADELKANGWTETPTGCFAKGDWAVEPDTSSWMIVSTARNPRVFDVPIPGEYESRWAANLIEHLCAMEDERRRLLTALETIRDNPADARHTAIDTLRQCYHRWLINVQIPEQQMGRVYCVICSALRSS